MDLEFFINLIGSHKTMMLIEHFGGLTYRMPSLHNDCKKAKRLKAILGDETAEILMRTFAGERVYICRFDDYFKAIRDKNFMREYQQMADLGMPKEEIFEQLVPKYKISDRWAYVLLKKQANNKLQGTYSNNKQLSFLEDK